MGPYQAFVGALKHALVYFNVLGIFFKGQFFLFLNCRIQYDLHSYTLLTIMIFTDLDNGNSGMVRYLLLDNAIP